MKRDTINIILWFVGLALIQVLLMNHLNIGGLINIFIYIYLILRLNSEYSTIKVLLIAFFLGLTIDFFSATWGIHTFATTFVAYFRTPLLRGLGVEKNKHIVPTLKTMSNFWLYSLIIIFVHNILLFVMEAFSWSLLPMSLLKGVISTILTYLLVLALSRIEVAYNKKH